MKFRCYNPNAEFYHRYRYGGRGIGICEEWRTDFAAFESDILAVIGPRPSLKHSLDRIDNDQDYHPKNMQWATQKEQCNNRRSNRFIEFRGKRMTMAQWEGECGIPQDEIEKRLRRNWTVERALTQPLRASRYPGRRQSASSNQTGVTP